MGKSQLVKELSVTDTMSEEQLQSAIIELAHSLGYMVAHFRPARVMVHGMMTYRTPVSADGKGFFDLVLVGWGRIIASEIKSEKGKLSPEQVKWARQWEASGGLYYLWRPSDWLNDTISKVLGGLVWAGWSG